MKRITIFCIGLLILSACGKAKSGSQLGQEVCDCSKKANGMDATDPKRAEEQANCSKMQLEAWNKVKDDQKKADEFNKVLSECASEQIRKSFGK